MEQGGTLCIPRGWWHVADPLDTPSLHLTVTVKNPTGVDLLKWLVHQLKTSEGVRMPLPLLDNDEAQAAWLVGLWKDLSAAWTPDLVRAYTSDSDRRAPGRPFVELPTVEPNVREDTWLQLAVARPIADAGGGDSEKIMLTAGSRRWECEPALASLIMRFNDGRAHRSSEFGSAPAVLSVMTSLVKGGVLRTLPDD